MTENTPPVVESSGPREVRQWRIGTISVGLTLIAVGALLLLGELNFAKVIKFWPVVLIILGIEMVLFNLLANLRASRVRFVYDGLSIFILILMLLVSSGLAVLESTGVLDLAERALQLSQRYSEAEKISLPTDASLESLILTVAEGTTNIRAYSGSEISITVVYQGYFRTNEEASLYAKNQFIRTERLGANLLVEVLTPSRVPLPKTQVQQEITILVPCNLNLDFQQERGKVTVVAASLEADWLLEGGDEEMAVRLDDVNDLLLQVEIAGYGRLGGNILAAEYQDGPSASKQWGTGEHKLWLRKDSGVIKIDVR